MPDSFFSVELLEKSLCELSHYELMEYAMGLAYCISEIGSAIGGSAIAVRDSTDERIISGHKLAWKVQNRIQELSNEKQVRNN